ncbi:MAG: LTA synthase family protein [Oscillospiraceae bacterium]|nr:LTA synthase family protein [Oscillospiraceae bacterium]
MDKSNQSLTERIAFSLEQLRLFLTHFLFLAGPVICLFIVETLNKTNPIENLNWTELWMNLVLYAVVWLALWVVLGRRRRAAATGSMFFFLAGLANHYVLEFKGIILFPHDIQSWKTALNVAGTYDFTPDESIWTALALLAGYLLLLAFVAVPQEKREYPPKPLLTVGIPIVAAVTYCYFFFFSSWLIDAGIKTQQWKTQSNGWVLNFSLALRYSRVEKPDAFSLNNVDTLTQQLSTDRDSSVTLLDDAYCATLFDPTTTDENQEAPVPLLSLRNDPNGTQPLNIICIMDESFGDLSLFENLTTDNDALPFLHSMEENTIKGWMYSPVTGGGTASVEYEFLTGNSIALLPPGTVAYQLYVKAGLPSLFSWANHLGFHTTAFHPYDRTGWNRVAVYHDLGADTQLYREDVKAPYLVRKYISDQSDFEKLMEITDAEEGDRQFIFNVTMQNHGGYKQGWNHLSKQVDLTGKLSGVSEYATQYLNLMKETDCALETLIHHYEQSDEPTLIVFFGDHQGKLSDWFYERLYGKKLDERSLTEVQRQYAVPFFIWANYDLPEAQDVIISTNYLGALTALCSNYPTTAYQDYLMKLYEALPVMGRVSYISADGLVTEDEEALSETQQTLLEQYRILSYYNLFHRKESIDQRFFQ